MLAAVEKRATEIALEPAKKSTKQNLFSPTNIGIKMANIEIIHEARTNHPNEWNLCFQWVRYHYNDQDGGGDPEMGYRFMWRRPNDNLAPQMGQARIPSAAELFNLLNKASEAGWFVTAEQKRDD